MHHKDTIIVISLSLPYRGHKGFRAEWKAVKATSGGRIKSPDFPHNYPNNKDQVRGTSICCIVLQIKINPLGMGSLCPWRLEDTTDFPFF